MRAAALLFTLSVIVSSAVPATAQRTNDPRAFTLSSQVIDQRDTNASTPPEVTMMRTAGCLADKRPDEVQTYLRSVPASEMEAAAFEEIQSRLNRCIPKLDMSSVGNQQRARGTLTLSFDHSTLRGALAESILRELRIELNAADMSLGDDGMYVAERYHGARSGSVQRVFALGFAGCVMGHNPDSIEALLQTEPGSAQERDAIRLMSDSFGQCVMENQELVVTTPILRNQIAEVTYYAQQIADMSEAVE